MAEASESRPQVPGRKEQGEEAVQGKDRRVRTRVIKGSAARPRGGRYYPSSSSLPGFSPATRSRTCQRCGFEAFFYAERCRCGEPFEQ